MPETDSEKPEAERADGAGPASDNKLSIAAEALPSKESESPDPSTSAPDSTAETSSEPAEPAELVDDACVRVIGITLIVCLIIFMVGLLPRAFYTDPRQVGLFEHYAQNVWQNEALAAVAGGIIAFLLYALKQEKWRNKLITVLSEHTRLMSEIPEVNLGFWIAFAAGLGLFAELIVIRGQASMLTMFAQFKNFTLLSCFLGLGVGYAQPLKRKLTTPLFLPLLTFQILLLVLFRFFDLNTYLQHPISEEVKMGLNDARQISDVVAYYGFVGFFFLLNATCFVPLGQLASYLMSRKPKLDSYNQNLIGSLLALLLVTILMFSWSRPMVWFGFIAVSVAIFFHKQASQSLITVFCSCLLLCAVAVPQRLAQIDVYSPYQLVSVVLDPFTTTIYSNSNWLQHILDLSPFNVKRSLDLQQWAPYYEMPYLFKPKPLDVLIVGAGSGNDAASAVRHGAKNIDAVEIDPAIVEIGKAMHPEVPYWEPSVHVTINDGRNFIKYTNKKYDLIVYGLLDSQHSLSASGGITTDSYIYTAEACKEARARLKPGGLICMTVCIFPLLEGKVYNMLKNAFDGKPPVVYHTKYDSGHCFIAGDEIPEPTSTPAFREITAECAANAILAEMPTDDWPFFLDVQTHLSLLFRKLSRRSFRSFHLIRAQTDSVDQYTNPQPLLFLGAGFMLIETKV